VSLLSCPRERYFFQRDVLADEDFVYDKFAVPMGRIRESLCIISTKHPEAVFLQTIIFIQLFRIPLRSIFNNYTATSAEFLHVIL
jgi:hypothetical protein